MKLQALEKLINRFAIGINEDFEPFEPYEPEDDRQQGDYEHHMEDFIQDLKTMTWEELYQERKKLQEDIRQCEMDEVEVPFIVEQKMKLVEKQLGSIKTLAQKFAMKLGLESYPFSFEKDEDDEPNEYKRPEQSSTEVLPEPTSETYQPHMFQEYINDLDIMTGDQLIREKEKLKNQIQRYHMLELQVPLILDKKLGLVDQRLDALVEDPTIDLLTTEISEIENPPSTFDSSFEKMKQK